jgi:hypothetical protein
METLSIRPSNPLEVSLRCGSDNPESNSPGAAATVWCADSGRVTGKPEVIPR